MFQFNTMSEYVNALVRLHQALSCRIKMLDMKEVKSQKIVLIKGTDLAMINLLSEISGVDSRWYFTISGMIVEVEPMKRYLSDIDSMIFALRSM